jgi:hypothetical protein
MVTVRQLDATRVTDPLVAWQKAGQSAMRLGWLSGAKLSERAGKRTRGLRV